MAPSRVNDAYVLYLLRRNEAKRKRVRFATVKFRIGQHMRIKKEKIKFAKVAQKYLSTEILRIVKVIDSSPHAFYEIEDLNGTTIDA